MKKILILTIFLLGFSVFATNENPTNCPTTDKGVLINGIRWATRNVDAPGTFAETPESPGMFFQWNRRKGWSTEVEDWDNFWYSSIPEGWDNSNPEGTKWYAKNDPCPEGWRVPTFEELEILENIDSEWVIKNGVNGRLFGIAPNQIFLPAAGRRGCIDGALLDTGGGYWSSTEDGCEHAWNFWFHSNIVDGVGWAWRTDGFLIRCVAK